MTEPLHAYPAVLDEVDLAADLTPPALYGSPWILLVRAIMRQLSAIDAVTSQWAAGLSDAEQATGAILDALGSRAGLVRGGLTEWEYRRLTVGALAARQARRDWTDAAALAMWRRLTGDASGTVETLAPGMVRFSAAVTWDPTPGWVLRAERVIRRAVPEGLLWSGVLVPSADPLLLDVEPGLDGPGLSWYLSGEGSA